MLLALGIFLILAQTSRTSLATYADEMRLRGSLFQGYSPSIRPVNHLDETVDVRLTLDLLNIEEMRWHDEHLRWDPVSYGNTERVYVHDGDNEDVWKPDVSAYNTISEFVELGNNHNPIVVKYDGTITMESGVILSTHCDVDVTYYPFDTQVCDIIIGTFVYTANEVNMTVQDIKIGNYRPNQEWELIDFTGRREEMTFDAEPQAVLDFRVTIKRRKPFFMMYLILPLIMLGFLNPVVFLLPPDAGEKMSLSITTLLTYAVFLTIIGDHVPSTSQHIPVLAFYLFITFLISCVCVWLSVLMLKFFHKPEDEIVPRWIRNITCGGLARLLCIQRHCPKCNRKIDGIDNNTITPEEMFENVPKCQNPHAEHSITWQGVVAIADKFNFWIFFALTSIVSLSVLIALLHT